MHGFFTNMEMRKNKMDKASRNNFTLTSDYNKRVFEVIILKNCISTFSTDKDHTVGSFGLLKIRNSERLAKPREMRCRVKVLSHCRDCSGSIASPCSCAERERGEGLDRPIVLNYSISCFLWTRKKKLSS